MMFQLQTPRPIDADQWHEHDELKIYHEALEQIEFADKLGYDYVFITEHHFLEEYCHSSAPKCSWRPRRRAPRISAGARHRPDAAEAEPSGAGGGAHRRPRPGVARPRRVRHRRGRHDHRNRRLPHGARGEEAGVGRSHPRMPAHDDHGPYPGYEGKYFSMPERNVIPKPLQKPHPPVWVASSRSETVMLAARLGIGALGVGFETPEDTEERVTRY